MPKKSVCCNDNLIFGIQCENCGADGRKFAKMTKKEKEEIIDGKINLEISQGECN